MREVYPKVKVVFATGYVLPQLDQKLEQQSHGVIMKPYDLSDVSRKVATAVERERV